MVSTQYTRSTDFTVLFGKVPAAAPESLAPWVQFTTLDGTGWWKWTGSMRSGSDVAWREWQVWKSTWSRTWHGPAPGTLAWAGSHVDTFAHVVETSKDPAWCATAALDVDDVLVMAAMHTVPVLYSDTGIVGCIPPGVAHTLEQTGDGDVVVSDSGVYVSGQGVQEWKVNMDGAVTVDGEVVPDQLADTLLTLGAYKTQVQVQMENFAAATETQWRQVQDGLLYAASTYKHVRIHVP